MKILETTFSVIFPVITKISRKIFDFEDALKSYFGPFQLVPIPEEAPHEIPRITTVSKGGYSSINISQSNFTFVTKYDNNFNENWQLCLGYLRERVHRVLPVLIGNVGEIYFSGLTTKILIEDIEDPIRLLNEKFIRANTKPTPFDINLKLSFCVEKVHYVNITLANTRLLSKDGVPEKIYPAYLKDSHQALNITLDVNDRFGFNFLDNYRSSYELSDMNISISDDIITNKLNKLVADGGVEL